MKLYNRKLEEIESQEIYNKINNMVEKQIEFLTNDYGIEKAMLEAKTEKLAIVERHHKDKTYFVEDNGKKVELNNNSSAAFVTIKKQEYDGEKWDFEIGVYISNSNSDHKISHELFHFLSKKQYMEYNENNIGYVKTGTLLSGYDINDKLADSSLRAEGLNEGITEMLAAKFNKCKPDNYEFQAYLADILISQKHNLLINSYFSDDKKDFEYFLRDFENRQDIISSDELINLTKDGQVVADVNLLKGCLKYALSFCKTIDEIEEEKNRLIPIFEGMTESLNIEFSEKQFGLNGLLDDIMQKNKKLACIDSKELLKSTIEVTESVTTYSEMNSLNEALGDKEKDNFKEVNDEYFKSK